MKRTALHFLFALFVVLQVHAPLVHAHIGGGSVPAAGHSYDIPYPHTHDAATTEIHSHDHHSQIVEIGNAIKQRGILSVAFLAVVIALTWFFVARHRTTHPPSFVTPPHKRYLSFLPPNRAPPSA